MFEYGWSQPWGQGPLGFVAGAAVGLWGTFDCFWGGPMCAATRPFWNDQRFFLESLGAEHEGTLASVLGVCLTFGGPLDLKGKRGHACLLF